MPDPNHAYNGPGTTGQQTTLDTFTQIADLCAWLRSPHRGRVVLVLTIADDRSDPWLDPGRIAAQHPDTVEVYVIRNGALTKRLAEYLPAECGVYAGGARIYPRWDEWRGEKARAPLFLARNASEQERLRARVPERVERLATGGDGLSGSHGASSVRTMPAIARRPVADGRPHHIESEAEANSLVDYLKDPARALPVVAISIHPDAGGEPYLDAESIAKELQDLALVLVLAPDATFGLTEALGDRQLSVFFGAARVYPVDTAWLTDMHRAPLRLCSGWNAAPKVGRRLLEDAVAAASAAGLIGAPTGLPADREATAHILGPVGELHSLVRLSDGRQALMLTADLRQGVLYDRLLSKGLRLSGHTRGAGLLPRFVPDPIVDDPVARATARFVDGSAALARVVEVGQDGARLQLHPGVEGTLRRDSPDDDLRDLVSVDDVVAVSVWWLAEGLQLAFADLDAAPRSMSVLPTGPDWLLVTDLEPAAAEIDDSAQAAVDAEQPPRLPQESAAATASEPPPASHGPLASTLASVQRELTLARAHSASLQDALAASNREVERLRARASGSRRTARRQRAETQAAHQPIYRDPEKQLRHEIWLSWLNRISEDERTTYPLPEHYFIGPAFIRSMNDLQGISRSKIVVVLVEVLTGLDRQLPGRQLHPWRSSRKGEQETRHDGAQAWRVSLQVESPGARRLKYWKLDGRIELDSVGHHDDYGQGR